MLALVVVGLVVLVWLVLKVCDARHAARQTTVTPEAPVAPKVIAADSAVTSAPGVVDTPPPPPVNEVPPKETATAAPPAPVAELPVTVPPVEAPPAAAPAVAAARVATPPDAAEQPPKSVAVPTPPAAPVKKPAAPAAPAVTPTPAKQPQAAPPAASAPAVSAPAVSAPAVSAPAVSSSPTVPAPVKQTPAAAPEAAVAVAQPSASTPATSAPATSTPPAAPEPVAPAPATPPSAAVEKAPAPVKTPQRAAPAPKPPVAAVAGGALPVTQFGIVANDPGAASANTRILRALLSPVEYGGDAVPVSALFFPDRGTYHFDDVIPLLPGARIDLRGSTLTFRKKMVLADRGAGFFFVLRDAVIKNGTIRAEVDNEAAIVHAGAALVLGTRKHSGASYFPDVLDSELEKPMGQIVIQDVHIVSSFTTPTKAGLRSIFMLGGLDDVRLENVSVDGSGQVNQAIYYEYGNATLPKNPAQVPRPDVWLSSHAHNMRFKNLTIRNLSPEGVAVSIMGAYDTVVDGLRVDGAKVGVIGSAGEAAFYRTWGNVPATRVITLRNLTMSNIGQTALMLNGSGDFKHGYLSRWFDTFDPAAQVDLLDYVVESFALEGTGAGWGVFGGGRRLQLRNGTIRGFQRGVVISNDCTDIAIEDVNIYDSTQMGVQMNFDASVLATPRPKRGYIKRTLIAGSGKDSKVNQGIMLNNAAQFYIEDNVFGYDNEKTQGSAVWLGTEASNVIVKGNTVRGIVPDNPAYRTLSASDKNALLDARGVKSSSGRWAATLPPDARPVTP